MLSGQNAGGAPLLVSGSSDIQGSVLNDTVVQRNSSLHVHGNLRGSLTIEAGANVIVEGSVDGKVVNRGGRLVVNNRGIAEYIKIEGPPEPQAGAVLRINLTAIALNWEALAKHSDAECAAVVMADACGCGIGPVTAALLEVGCKTFFVSNLAEAKSVRAVAPTATIYVLGGLYGGTAPAFADCNARPVVNSLIELAEWDVFTASSQWSGGFALNVDTGMSRLGLSLEEATAIAGRANSSGHGIMLLMSRLDHADKPGHPENERQIKTFQELRRFYSGVPASLADSAGIFLDPKAHHDLVRAGAALFGVNPTPAGRNPMLPVVELRARIVKVHNLGPGETSVAGAGWAAKRPMRIAIAAVGYADGYPHAGPDTALRAVVGGRLCKVLGRASMDLLALDVTDLTDPTAARHGAMVTLIGGDLGIDDLAAAARASPREVLTGLGRRFHRIYHAI